METMMGPKLKDDPGRAEQVVYSPYGRAMHATLCLLSMAKAVEMQPGWAQEREETGTVVDEATVRGISIRLTAGSFGNRTHTSAAKLRAKRM
jgi:hypothetical protein